MPGGVLKFCFTYNRGDDESRFFFALLLADKLMVGASADFHNFEGDESLSGVPESHFSFLPEFLEKFDCYEASWCVGG